MNTLDCKMETYTKVSGERAVEGKMPKAEWLSHLSRYRLAQQHVVGKDVLDLACGSGYGSHMLALSDANSVLGVDISQETVASVQVKYSHPKLRFQVGDGEAELFDSDSFDTIVSFETIEHMNSPERFVENVVAWLRPTGTLLISTPNLDALFGVRTSFSPFHNHEFHFNEFDDLLKRHFQQIEYFWQPWPLEMAHARRYIYQNLEKSGSGWLRRAIPKWMRRVMNSAVNGVMSLRTSEGMHRPQPWSALRCPTDACLIVAVAKLPRKS